MFQTPTWVARRVCNLFVAAYDSTILREQREAAGKRQRGDTPPRVVYCIPFRLSKGSLEVWITRVTSGIASLGMSMVVRVSIAY